MIHLLTICILLTGKYFDTTYMIYALIFKFTFLIKESNINLKWHLRSFYVISNRQLSFEDRMDLKLSF
jgi:hypothetical protein